MADAGDAHDVVPNGEHDAIVAEAQAKLTGPVSMQRLDVAAAGAGAMKKAVEDSHGGGAVQAANVGRGLIQPLDAEGRHLLVQWKVLGLQAELGEQIFHRNTFAASEEGFAFAEAAEILVCYGLFFLDHDFEQMNDGGEFARSEMAEQFMGFRFERVNGHDVLLGAARRWRLKN